MKILLSPTCHICFLHFTHELMINSSRTTMKPTIVSTLWTGNSTLFVAVWTPQSASSSFAKFAFREATTQWFSALSWSNALQWKTCSWRFGSGRRKVSQSSGNVGDSMLMSQLDKWEEPEPFLGYSPENDVSQASRASASRENDVLRNGCSFFKISGGGSTWFRGSTPWNWWFCFKEQRFGKKLPQQISDL